MSGSYDIDDDRAVTDYDVEACKNSLIRAIAKLPDKCPTQDIDMLKAFQALVTTRLPPTA